ncbi:dihydrolipoamide acyltransferase [Rhodococcus wratislaviensis]|uniref:Dihydrolipoamide acetyltransferase component of pyruvate dehydrogenase complex n=1 Tax=Rhodococcus wratislaviensis TaxID=44752 RepID=A0AB38F6L3_RHOWR|nr:dihydrolipoamide acyltransferase [Rhodococcus wratislaviensis]
MTTTQTGTTVVLPSLGENVTEATITRWLKARGDRVEAGEPLLEVATDKVDTEIPSPAAGIVLDILVPEHALVATGGAIAVISDGGAEKAMPEHAPEPHPVAVSGTADRVETLPRIRRIIARRMLESLQTSAQLTTVVEVDVTEIARLRNREKEVFHHRTGVKLSFLPFFAAAAVEALDEHPVINSSLNTDCTEVTYHSAVHLGMTVDTDKGLMVTVIRDAGALRIPELAR